MNYIVLDTEWNSCFWKSKKKFINELVEFGAIKLDENFNIVSTYNAVIKSQLTDKLSQRFIDLTNITNEEMLNGKPFEVVINEYSEWAGRDTITLTWSNSDIYTLFYNCNDFLNLNYIPGITYYSDAQKIVQNYLIFKGHTIKSQISLENAANLMNVSTENIKFHRAIDDSKLTAKLFVEAVKYINLKNFIVNTRNKEYFKKISFKPYYISNIKSKYVKKSKMNFTCSVCNKKAKRISDWQFKNNAFCAEFYCKNCNNKFIGNVSFKKQFDKVNIKKYRQEKQ